MNLKKPSVEPNFLMAPSTGTIDSKVKRDAYKSKETYKRDAYKSKKTYKRDLRDSRKIKCQSKFG